MIGCSLKPKETQYCLPFPPASMPESWIGMVDGCPLHCTALHCTDRDAVDCRSGWLEVNQAPTLWLVVNLTQNYSVVQCNHCTALHYTTQHNTALHCTVLTSPSIIKLIPSRFFLNSSLRLFTGFWRGDSALYGKLGT
jgi:hypothetical protein